MTHAGFDKVLKTDSWLAVQEFGEIVTYKPNGEAERQIVAIIDRSPPEAINEAPGNLAPSIVIEVRNDSTYGIASSGFSKTLDKVSLPVRYGETATDRPLIKILAHDVGMCRFGVG